ncbi:MAG: pyrimidine dimer DNA glycosylase/endonuclease V [Sulfolobales archaeon]|nr:pyrimidine dimer DNA glycosylase/endonuclease V [Sulfolobales archaeon]
MRLWSINPNYLDRVGLLALWREGLLAQKVLMGCTRGYRNHPQLVRFKGVSDPLLAIGSYLYHVYLEASSRGYGFSLSKIKVFDHSLRSYIPVTRGQLHYEFKLLLKKLKLRDVNRFNALKQINVVEPHPIFYVVEGDVEVWEKVKALDLG